MKIKDFAEENGLTRAAIYNQITRNGLKTNQITDKRGEITEQGRRILEGLITKEAAAEDREELDAIRETIKAAEADRDALQRERDDLRIQLKEAQERADKWETLYLELQDRAAHEREQSAEQLNAAHVLLSQQQDINRYLSMNPIKRLFSGRSRKEIEIKGSVE